MIDGDGHDKERGQDTTSGVNGDWRLKAELLSLSVASSLSLSVYLLFSRSRTVIPTTPLGRALTHPPPYDRPSARRACARACPPYPTPPSSRTPDPPAPGRTPGPAGRPPRSAGGRGGCGRLRVPGHRPRQPSDPPERTRTPDLGRKQSNEKRRYNGRTTAGQRQDNGRTTAGQRVVHEGGMGGAKGT